jgi:predicted ATPase
VLLRITGEREYTVPLLGVPDPHGVPSPEQLITYEAARLFIERAQAVKADFTVTAENASVRLPLIVVLPTFC